MADNEQTTPEVTASVPVSEGTTTPQTVITDASTTKKVSKVSKLVDEVKRVEGEIVEDAKKVGEMIVEKVGEMLGEAVVAEVEKVIEHPDFPSTDTQTKVREGIPTT